MQGVSMYTFESRVRYSETDSEGKLTMASLINYLQDCSIFHSEAVGLGVECLKKLHLAWVLSSWQIVVDRYPALGETISVGTQPYDMKGFIGYRNFAITDEAGKYIAKANSIWSLLDTQTGRPVAVSDEMVQKYGLKEKLDMEYAPRKIVVSGESVRMEPLTVKKHHLDTNYHVNNQQFIDMAMDYLPEGFPIRQVRAEYKKQAFLDDVLVPCVSSVEDRVFVVLQDEVGAVYMSAEFLKGGADAV